jgi:hypothetical protein
MVFKPNFFNGDSLEYDLLYRAAQAIKGVSGMTLEIGLREGGGTETIIQACIDNEDIRIHLAIDPYGNISYAPNDRTLKRLDYTNRMRDKILPYLYFWCAERGVDFHFLNLEDTEFFARFQDGYPTYKVDKVLNTQYALVHFDGPHSAEIVLAETVFFEPRTPTGGVWVFDDVKDYKNEDIDANLLTNGWKRLIVGERKIAYQKGSHAG